MGSFWKNVLTFGAHGRVESEMKYYEFLVQQVNTLNEQMEQRRGEVNATLLEVIKIKKNAILELKKSRQITRNLRVKDRELINLELTTKRQTVNFERIELSINIGIEAVKAGRGLSAGFATASSAYFLVGTFASASTGTAISALSGAAATNATLAWLGGGSIAAGGGGIAAGTAVMGGLVALPALAVMGVLSHLSANKEIKKIKEKELEAYKLMDTIKKNLLAFDLIEQRANEVNSSLEKATKVYTSEFKRIYKILYPTPFISKMIKWLKKHLFKKAFSDSELVEIAHLIKIISNVLKIVETPVIEEGK